MSNATVAAVAIREGSRFLTHSRRLWRLRIGSE